MTPEMAAVASPVDVETQDASASSTPSTPDLALATEPAIELSEDAEPDMSAGPDEQLTGRVPSGPLTELPTPSTSTSPSLTGTSPNLGRVRGNTGPLGPLPPDRTGSSNTSWSDSSLASIEDFSSILDRPARRQKAQAVRLSDRGYGGLHRHGRDPRTVRLHVDPRAHGHGKPGSGYARMGSAGYAIFSPGARNGCPCCASRHRGPGCNRATGSLP